MVSGHIINHAGRSYASQSLRKILAVPVKLWTEQNLQLLQGCCAEQGSGSIHSPSQVSGVQPLQARWTSLQELTVNEDDSCGTELSSIRANRSNSSLLRRFTTSDSVFCRSGEIIASLLPSLLATRLRNHLSANVYWWKVTQSARWYVIQLRLHDLQMSVAHHSLDIYN